MRTQKHLFGGILDALDDDFESRLVADEMLASAMAAVLASSGRSRMKTRSIFNTSSGKRFK